MSKGELLLRPRKVNITQVWVVVVGVGGATCQRTQIFYFLPEAKRGGVSGRQERSEALREFGAGNGDHARLWAAAAAGVPVDPGHRK